jgi:hypothetical protein
MEGPKPQTCSQIRSFWLSNESNEGLSFLLAVFHCGSFGFPRCVRSESSGEPSLYNIPPRQTTVSKSICGAFLGKTSRQITVRWKSFSSVFFSHSPNIQSRKTNFHHELISSKDTETIEVDISKMNFDQYLAYLEKKAQM